MNDKLTWLERIPYQDIYDLKTMKIKNRDDYFKAFYGLYNQKVVIKDPFKIHLEVTNHCNLNCKMCPREKMMRKKGYIDKKLAKQIIKDGSENNLYHLSLFMHGEPLLHPDIFELAEYAKQMNIPIVHISTNGILLDKSKADEFLKIGIDTLVISFSAVSKKNYIEMIGNENQYEKVVRNIEYICRKKKELGVKKPFIRFNTVSNPELVNEEDRKNFIARWGDIVDDILFQYAGPYGYGNEYCHLSDGVEKYRVPCRQIWRQFAILWDGDISPCCVDINGEIKLGNIKDKTLRDLWNSYEFNNLRFKHLINNLDEFDMCKNCGLDWDF